MFWIYILLLENHKFYIGKTVDIKKKIGDHFSGKGSPWTKLYKPLQVLKKFETNDILEEDNQTKKYMIEHGIDNVRGGSYSSIELDQYQISALNAELYTFHNTMKNRSIDCSQNVSHNHDKIGHTKVDNRSTSSSNKLDASTNSHNRLYALTNSHNIQNVSTKFSNRLDAPASSYNIQSVPTKPSNRLDAPVGSYNIQSVPTKPSNILDASASSRDHVITRKLDETICHKFIENRCVYGNHCRFSHKYTDEYVEKNLCTHFQRDACTEAKCRFIHLKSNYCKKRILPQTNNRPVKFRAVEKPINSTDFDKIIVNNISCAFDDGVVIKSITIPSSKKILLKCNLFPDTWKNIKNIGHEMSLFGINIRYSIKIENGYHLILWPNTQEDIYKYVDELSTMAVCESHRIINCTNVSCCLSLQDNKFNAEAVCDNHINQIKLHTGLYNHEYVINHLSLSVYGVEFWRKISPNCVAVVIKNNVECVTNILYDNDYLPDGVRAELDFPVMFRHCTKKHSGEEMLELALDKTHNQKITVVKHGIIIDANNLSDKLAMYKQIRDIYTSCVLPIDFCLLIPFDKIRIRNEFYYSEKLSQIASLTLDSVPKFCEVIMSKNIDRIIISGTVYYKRIAKENILRYFSLEPNRLTETIIDLNPYQKSVRENVRQYITQGQTIDKIGVTIHMIDDLICVRGSRSYVELSLPLIKDAIDTIAKTNASANYLEKTITEKCRLCKCRVKNKIILNTCECSFCFGCFKSMVMNAYNNKNATRISCIGCNAPIKLSDLKVFMQSELNKIYTAAFDKYMSNNREHYIRCLTPKCDGIYHKNSQNILHCKLCSSIWCLKCKKNYFGKYCTHDNLSCDDFEIANNENTQLLQNFDSTEPCFSHNIST